jgi:hypothetical protein
MKCKNPKCENHSFVTDRFCSNYCKVEYESFIPVPKDEQVRFNRIQYEFQVTLDYFSEDIREQNRNPGFYE